VSQPSPADCYAVSPLEDVDAAFGQIVTPARAVIGTELIPANAAAGRVAAEDVRTATALPPFDHSAVDGYGLGPADAARERCQLRLVDRVRAGAAKARYAAGPGETVRLLTGAAVPHGVAAVIFEERCRLSGDTVAVAGPVPLGANIRREGEDVARGEVVVDAGTALDARHLALLAAAGVTSVRVTRRVRVAVLSNGDELREPGERLEFGTIHDSNRPMLLALLARPVDRGDRRGAAPGRPRRPGPDARRRGVAGRRRRLLGRRRGQRRRPRADRDPCAAAARRAASGSP
jgi:molybdopterin molybdotransferase